MDDRRHDRLAGWRVVGLVVTTVVVALALLLPGGAPPAAVPAAVPAAPAQRAATGEAAAAAAVLADWDARRAEAWAGQDAAALRGLYAAGSGAAAADLRLLRRWQEAGWRVEDLTTQVLRLRVRRASAERLELRVVDRVAGGRVVDEDGRERALPGTAPRARTLVLERVEGRWRLSGSARAPRAARP